MTERQANLRDSSPKISRILGVLYSQDKLSKCRSITILNDLTNEILHKSHVIGTGSWAEGTSISGSDIDLMFITHSIFALRSSNDIPSDSVESKSYFKMDFRRARAGFCTLLVLELHEDKDIIPGINLKISECLATYGDQTYLTHTRLGNSMVEFSKMFQINLFKVYGINANDTYRNGPCVSATLQGVPGESTFGSSDYACAIICPYWPDAAMEWVSRPRLHGWPSNKLIDHVKQMHCHLLPVGDTESGEIDLEWRFAFVYQERELLWSFSTIQIQCYVLLKALKKVFLSPIFHAEISSFHLKTVMFWLIENEGPDMWTEENLLRCVVLCLEKLKECINAMHLLHFFLRERNLLFNKFKQAECRREVLSVLTHVQENIFHSVCDVFSLFRSPSIFAENLRKGLPIFGTNNDDTMAFHQASIFSSHSFTVQNFEVLFTVAMSDYVSIASLDYLQQTIGVMDLDERFIHAFKTFLRIRMAIQFFAYAQTPKDEISKMLSIITAHGIFKDACELDGMSGHLYYATFDLVRGEIKASKDRVLRLFQINRCLYYDSKLSRKRKIIVNNGNVTQTDEEPFQNIKLGSNECVALNVLFMKQDLVCLPEALKYECALLLGTNAMYFSIHPVIYSYFLLVTAFQLQDNAEDVKRYLEHLEGAVMDTEISFDRHIALNLLGFAYFKAGNLEKAYTIFSQSLQEHNSSRNAAVYHLCILILDVYSRIGSEASQTNVIYVRHNTLDIQK